MAMEATCVYRKPIWHMLEGRFELVLANAAHIRNVPGRKSDVNDAVWISDLLAHGLIRASFVPPAPIQELRDLTRTRTQLTRELAQHIQRIQKTLEDANIKLVSAISDIVGMSGRRILAAFHLCAPFPRAREGGASATGFDPAAPARSYGDCSARADRNRWLRGPRFTFALRFLARGRAAPQPPVSIRRRRRAATGTVRREPIETGG